MLTAEQQERLTRVGSGTPMGALLRRYWMPVAASVELAAGTTRAVRLLGEDLVLFRSTRGDRGLPRDARRDEAGACRLRADARLSRARAGRAGLRVSRSRAGATASAL